MSAEPPSSAWERADFAPWQISAEGLLIIEGPTGSIAARSDGLHVRDARKTVVYTWGDLVSVSLSIPGYRLWVWWFYRFAQYFGNGWTVPPREIELYVTALGERHTHSIGRPENAPFASRVRNATDGLLSVLAEKKWADNAHPSRLRLLGTPVGSELVQEVIETYRWSGGFWIKGVRTAIETVQKRHGITK